MRYINHKSDFQVIINIKDKDGNIISPPSVPWEAVFSDENCVEFKCYFDGTNYTHCIVDGNDIVCFVDNPGFSCGKLRCTFHQHVQSADYCDGVMDLSQPLQCDIMLSKRESDDSTPITIEASPNWARGLQGEKGDKGDKGDTGNQGPMGPIGPQGIQGIQGIQGEKGADGFSPIVSLSKDGSISTISITDAQGEHTTEIADGAKGDDGFSPIVSLNKVDKVTTLTITDANGEHSAEIKDGETIDAYTKAESDARYLRGEVLYEDYYYPNMSPTTDTTRFSDSTEILQPTKFIGEYTDKSGQKYNCVFECDNFPDWFDFAEGNCYPYGNGISVAIPFFKNYTIVNGELVYDFNSLQNATNIAKQLPCFTVGVGLKKIDDNHFNLYKAKDGRYEFTSFDKENVDCSLFAFSPVTYNPIYDVDGCKSVRITLTGNFQSPSRYSSLLNGSCDVGLIGYNNRQVLYGDEYVEIEIDKNNNRWRQVKSGYSMFYRSSNSQNWSANKPESYESECRCLWSNIPNGTVAKICMINNKVCYSFTYRSSPSTLLLMGCKIKIEKLA